MALFRNLGLYNSKIVITLDQKKSYDCNSKGESAPETVFTSIKQGRKMFQGFSSVECYKENCDDLRCKGHLLISRKKMLSTVGRWLGLDIYIKAKK